MASLWRTLRQEVIGTVDEFRQKGAVGALRDAALDTRDIASDTGSWLWDGVKNFVDGDPDEIAQLAVLRCESIPVRGATAQLEFADGSVVEALVVDIDGVSEPPRARVTVPGVAKPLLVVVLPPGVSKESLGTFQEDNAAAASSSLISGLREDWSSTVQEFREKGALGAARDAAFDAVDIVGATAKTAVEGARSIAKPLIDWEPSADGTPQKVSEEASSADADADAGSNVKGRANAAGIAAANASDGADSPGGAVGDAAAGALGHRGDAGSEPSSSSQAGAYTGSLLDDLKQELRDTVQDFREKGAVGAVKDATLDAVGIVGSAAAVVADTTRTYAAPLLEKAPDIVASVGSTAAAVAKQTQVYAAPLLEKASTLPDLWVVDVDGSAGGTSVSADGPSKESAAAATVNTSATCFAPPPRSMGGAAGEPPSQNDDPRCEGPSAAAPQAPSSSPDVDGKPQKKSLVSMRRNMFEKPKDEPKEEAKGEAKEEVKQEAQAEEELID